MTRGICGDVMDRNTAYSWWAMLPFESWRFHSPDPSRPTENEALSNIAYESYLAYKFRLHEKTENKVGDKDDRRS